MDKNELQELVNRPRESLNVELKRWINPDAPDGIAKIVKAALAMRNSNGGYLLIGFDNATLLPDKENIPKDVVNDFHPDKIQGYVARYASQSFEVSVDFIKRDALTHPVISIPTGIKTPVAAKADLKGPDGKDLIRVNDVYVRSLNSNNTPSTTNVTYRDWDALAQTIFDNREADIGRFLRRHLSGLTKENIAPLAQALTQIIEPEKNAAEKLLEFINASEGRFSKLLQEQKITLPPHGAWQAALIIDGEVPEHKANRDFTRLLDSKNPNYTGWPVWLDSSNFSDKASHPFVHEKIWEALIISLKTGWGAGHIDFQRLDPLGRFYLRRAYYDDTIEAVNKIPPLKFLDFGLMIYRVAEVLAVGISFAKAMGCDPDKCKLNFAFKWDKLKGRELSSWANPERYISGGRLAYQDEVTAFCSFPLNISPDALGAEVKKIVDELFEVFGFDIPHKVVDDFVWRLLNRKM